MVIAIVGFLSSSDSGSRSTSSATWGSRGRAADAMRDALETAEGSRKAASIVGLVGLLWSGLGVVGPLQDRAQRRLAGEGAGPGRGLRLRWLLGAGALFLATAALGALLRLAPGPAKPVTVLLGLS